jgi:acyl-CoA synthetase (AMP-forming)/AMP-acid ligase II
LAEPAEAIDIAETLASLPPRIHQVMDQFAEKHAHQPALVEDGATWTYRELQRSVRQIAAALQSLWNPVRRPHHDCQREPALRWQGLLLAASRIDAWAIVVNPRLSPRELDQIRDHSGSATGVFHDRCLEGSGEPCRTPRSDDRRHRDR